MSAAAERLGNNEFNATKFCLIMTMMMWTGVTRDIVEAQRKEAYYVELESASTTLAKLQRREHSKKWGSLFDQIHANYQKMKKGLSEC